MLERLFHLRALGTTWRTELLAGLTTFATMSYILAVNPHILAVTGMPLPALVTVTAVACTAACLLMGFVTNYPIALAPQMGANAYFAYQVCLGMKIPWEAALGFVFYNAVLFYILAATGIREMLIRAFPPFLRAGIMAGVGLFIAFIGLRNGGIIVGDPETLVALGPLSSPGGLMVLGGVALISILLLRGFKTAIMVSIVVLTVLGLFLPAAGGKGFITPLPTQIISLPSSMAPIFLHLDLTYPFHHFQAALPIILALLFTDFFCCFAAQLAICQRAGLLDADSNLPGMRRALCVDASAAGMGALCGTSTVGCYIESAAGVEQGGRTGLTAVVTGLCFLAAIFFNPLIQIIPAVATAPALIIIGIFMMKELTHQNFADLTQATPAVLTVVLMPLASIGDGIAIGFLTHVVMQAGMGKIREVSWFSWILAGLFVAHYVWI